MLSFDEALDRILEAVPGPRTAKPVPLVEALGRPLAEPIFADADLPLFDNSAVDGYALNSGGVLAVTSEFEQVGEVAAGAEFAETLRPGQGVRIFTGAPVPPGADAIVMQEHAEPGPGTTIRITEAGAASAKFIRHRGSDVARGTRVLETGAVIGPGEIGLLAALNRESVPCPPVPRVGILTTGDELVAVGGATLGVGQIRDANGPALVAAVAQAGGVVVGRRHARDTREAVHNALDELSDCDVLIASGGVSVGAYDVVRAVLEERGALDFWRIAIKPGKPLAFGKIGDSLFLGLPGNPVSSLVTFELFVRPALRKLAGFQEVTRRRVTATLTEHLPHEPGRREFVRATLEWQGNAYHATPTGAQASHRLASLLGADCLLVAHEDHGDYVSGERLSALLLTG